MAETNITRILRRKQVEAETGYSRSTIYLRIAQGLWPRPVSLGPRAVGWPAREVAALNAARIAGREDDEIRVGQAPRGGPVRRAIAARLVRAMGLPNYRLVKTHRSYTVEEIARLLGVHRGTVREWVKRGLPTCDGRRPILILGYQLSDYLRDRRLKKKRPCLPGELYCVRCRTPRLPDGNMADMWK